MSTAAVPNDELRIGEGISAPAPARDTLPLPIEINQMIYKLVFDKSYKVIWKGGDKDLSPAKSLSLLLVSSTIHKEARIPLYLESTFVFDLHEYQAVPAAVYKAKVQAARNARLIAHHINDPWSDYKHLTARVDRFIRTFANRNDDRRRLELDMNKFFIKRLTNWVTLQHLEFLELVEIHALVSSRTIYGGHRFHPFCNHATTHSESLRLMGLLVKDLEYMFGPVEVTRSGTEGMTVLHPQIRDSSAFYLHVTVRPKQAVAKGLGHWP